MPRRRDKKRAVTSLDVVTTRSPSGLNAALFTAPPCPLSLAALSAILDRQTSEIDPTRLMKLRTAVAPDGGARKVCSADLAQWHSVEASQHVIGHRGMIPGQLLLFVT
jgi:hypothetical protein